MKMKLLRAIILFYIIRGMKNNTVTLKWEISYTVFQLMWTGLHFCTPPTGLGDHPPCKLSIWSKQFLNLHISILKTESHVPAKYQYLHTRLYGVATQKTTMWTITVMKTLKLQILPTCPIQLWDIFLNNISVLSLKVSYFNYLIIQQLHVPEWN